MGAVRGWGRFGARLVIGLTSGLLAHGAAHAQDGKGKPSIAVASIILVEPMVETPVPIQVGPQDSVPRNSFLRVRGLPPQAAFSDGHFVSAGTWALPLAGLNDLKLTLPLTAAGRSELQIALLAIDGTLLAESKLTLAVTANPAQAQAIPRVQSSTSASLGPAPDLMQSPRPALQRAEPPVVAGISPPDRERATKLMSRGDQELAGGDVAGARLLYQRAADAGLPEAALAMGATFDPAELARRSVKGFKGDAESAKKWYERARSLGASGAEDRLRRMGAQ